MTSPRSSDQNPNDRAADSFMRARSSFDFPSSQRLHEPLRFASATGPGERRVLRVPVISPPQAHGRISSRADKFGEGVAQFPARASHLGAGFRLLPILECGKSPWRRPSAFSSACRATVPRDRKSAIDASVSEYPVSIARRCRAPQLPEGKGRGGNGWSSPSLPPRRCWTGGQAVPMSSVTGSGMGSPPLCLLGHPFD